MQNTTQFRISASLVPTAMIIFARPWIPAIVSTPAAFYYPAVFLATLIGNFYAGLISTIICTLHTLFILRPHLLRDPTSDSAGLTRTVMFFSTSILFLTLIALLEKALLKEKKATALRDEFISMVSHELRTPITSIKLNIEVIKSKIKSNPDHILDVISSLERQTARQERLINAMINLTLIDSGQLNLFKEKCNINMIVRSACEAAIESLNKGVVEYHLVDARLEVDRKKFEEAVFNLVHNSIRYGDESPIVVSIINHPDHTIVEIRNKGIEIPESDQKLIFERFARPNVKSSIQGLGLGLYLARHFVELHEGKIEVSSGKGKDTVFSVILPNTTKLKKS